MPYPQGCYLRVEQAGEVMNPNKKYETRNGKWIALEFTGFQRPRSGYVWSVLLRHKHGGDEVRTVYTADLKYSASDFFHAMDLVEVP